MSSQLRPMAKEHWPTVTEMVRRLLHSWEQKRSAKPDVLLSLSIRRSQGWLIRRLRTIFPIKLHGLLPSFQNSASWLDLEYASFSEGRTIQQQSRCTWYNHSPVGPMAIYADTYIPGKGDCPYISGAVGCHTKMKTASGRTVPLSHMGVKTENSSGASWGWEPSRLRQTAIMGAVVHVTNIPLLSLSQ